MSDIHYEDAANVLRVFLEDERKPALTSEWDLQTVLQKALTNRYLSRNVGGDLAETCAMDDAISIINNIDTLRPILESYWRNS